MPQGGLVAAKSIKRKEERRGNLRQAGRRAFKYPRAPSAPKVQLIVPPGRICVGSTISKVVLVT
jgi:hypothetical protein